VIIDFHTHMRAGQGELDDFLRGMDEQGIDMAVVSNIVRHASLHPDEFNRFTYDQVSKHPDRLIGFASLHPQQPGAPELLERYITDYGFRGLKLHPCMQDFAPNDPAIGPVIAKAIELDIPILIHTGPIFVNRARLLYGDPALTDELALAFPQAKIVMAHGDPLSAAPAIVAKNPNVHMDTAITFARLSRLIPGLAEETLGWIMTGIDAGRDEFGGASKILFGSDANPSKTWRFAYSLDPIKQMAVPDPIKEQILSGNARRLLKLDV
jgi:predicted TIM-barrel fold metal-dependent hydrolase